MSLDTSVSGNEYWYTQLQNSVLIQDFIIIYNSNQVTTPMSKKFSFYVGATHGKSSTLCKTE